MAWIESHQKLFTDPKFGDFVEKMKINENEAIGILHRFWWWCVDHADSGDLRRFNDIHISRAVGLNSSESKKFIDSMVQAGFLEREPYFRVKNWWKFTKSWLKTKYKDTPERWKSVQSLYIHTNSLTGTGNESNPLTGVDITNPLDGVVNYPSGNPMGSGDKQNQTKPNQNTVPVTPFGVTSVVKIDRGSIALVIKGWKIKTNVDLNDKSWDRVHYGRAAKSAKQLLDYFGGNVKNCLDCIDDIAGKFIDKGFSFTFETIVKHSAEWKRDNENELNSNRNQLHA